MNLRSVLSGIILLFYFSIGTASAQVVTSPDTGTQSSSQSANLPSSVDSGTNANNTIAGVTGFISELEKLSGGFVFSTPDLFGSTIKLIDGTTINGLSAIRNIFIPIAVPITAILIFWVGGANMTKGNISFIKPFLGRIAYYGVLALTLTTFLSYSIKIENALTSVILTIPSEKVTTISSFSNNYFNAAQNQISSGKSTPESLGIYSSNITSFFQSIGYRITMVFLGLITILALILGIIFILAQFALRFLGLLFLSLIFPLVIPFVITEKTEGIFYSYLKIWFTFLIHQPAFALGYVIIMIIAKSILTANGASLGLFFLYIASLFFLGTINVLTARIFADAWVALGANLEAGAFARTGSALAFQLGGFGWGNRKNILNGAKAIGKSAKESFNNFNQPSKRVPNLAWAPGVNADYGNKMLNPGIRGGVDTVYGNPPAGYIPNDPKPIDAQARSISQTNNAPRAQALPTYAKEFNNKGFFVKQTDKGSGIYTVSGKGYSYYDSKNDLTHTFPSKRDAIDSGYKEEQIRQTTISKRSVVDLSQFPKGNPHNAYATKRAQDMGFKSNYAHVTPRSDAIRIKHNLEMNNENFKKAGVQGYIVKHYDNPDGTKSKRSTTRIITVGNQRD